MPAAVRELDVGTVPVNDAVVGQPTTFGVVQLDDPAGWTVTDLATGNSPATSLVERGLEIHTTVDRHRFRISR